MNELTSLIGVRATHLMTIQRFPQYDPHGAIAALAKLEPLFCCLQNHVVSQIGSTICSKMTDR